MIGTIDINKRIRKKVQKHGACVICKRTARMVAPAFLCMKHWHKWWNAREVSRVTNETTIVIKAQVQGSVCEAIGIPPEPKWEIFGVIWEEVHKGR